MDNESKSLVESILKWWNEHQYDTCENGEYNIYDEEPKFVTIAKRMNKI